MRATQLIGKQAMRTKQVPNQIDNFMMAPVTILSASPDDVTVSFYVFGSPLVSTLDGGYLDDNWVEYNPVVKKGDYIRVINILFHHSPPVEIGDVYVVKELGINGVNVGTSFLLFGEFETCEASPENLRSTFLNVGRITLRDDGTRTYDLSAVPYDALEAELKRREPKYYNGIVKAARDYPPCFYESKQYQFINGCVVSERGIVINRKMPVISLNEFRQIYKIDFEEVTEGYIYEQCQKSQGA